MVTILTGKWISTYDEIARIRHISKDQDCISPAVNPECTSPKHLLAFIEKLRRLSDGKPIGFKL